MGSRQQAGSRDERWFEDLYRSHHGALLAYARRRVEDPDDVVAEVFASAWRSRQSLPDPPLPWLYRAASNHVLHVYRAQGRRDRLRDRISGLAVPALDHADSVVARLDGSERVRTALARLSRSDQELLTLIAWDELPREDIAFVLGCSTASLRVRLRRARLRFAAELARLDDRARDHGTLPTPVYPQGTKP